MKLQHAITFWLIWSLAMVYALGLLALAPVRWLLLRMLVASAPLIGWLRFELPSLLRYWAAMTFAAAVDALIWGVELLVNIIDAVKEAARGNKV